MRKCESFLEELLPVAPSILAIEASEVHNFSTFLILAPLFFVALYFLMFFFCSFNLKLFVLLIQVDGRTQIKY